MSKEHYMELEHSESVIANMSATVFAALIQRDTLTTANEDELINRAVNIAIKLAERTDKLVKSDSEWVKPTAGGLFL